MTDFASTKARVIAYYLPQFHPIPQNDEWWGPGFTEWTNVGKAKPLFRGHDQPRVPADLGYYDLRLPEVREMQAKLAKDAGIEGFMYWHYWFGKGKRILEMPFNEVIKSGKPDFPICLGWANHSWRSDSWKNKNGLNVPKLLLEQTYLGLEDYTKHFFDVLPAFLDKRYIRHKNKPVFLVYSPLEVVDCRLFIDTWNNLAIKNGLDGIHFVGMSKAWSTEIEKIFDLGFDAINRNGQWEAECLVKGKFTRILRQKILESVAGLYLNKYDYTKVVRHMFGEYEKQANIYPTILPQWDRSARSGRQAVIYTNSSPSNFEAHLKDALNAVKHKDFEDRFIFLKSWNEWGEGNYVEPDLKHGREYLDVIHNQLCGQ